MKLIYAIQHNQTKRIYVGCTGNSSRIPAHMTQLRCGTHPIELMQEDCVNHGFDFTVRTLQIVSDHAADECESKWMHHFNTGDKRYGYNYKDRMARKKRFNSFPTYDDEWVIENYISDSNRERNGNKSMSQMGMMVTPKTAAKMMVTSQKAIYNLLREKKIEAYLDNGRWKIPVKSLDKYIEERLRKE